MKIILSTKNTLELSREDSKALRDEMQFACTQVSVFPVMERVLALMSE